MSVNKRSCWPVPFPQWSRATTELRTWFSEGSETPPPAPARPLLHCGWLLMDVNPAPPFRLGNTEVLPFQLVSLWESFDQSSLCFCFFVFLPCRTIALFLKFVPAGHDPFTYLSVDFPTEHSKEPKSTEPGLALWPTLGSLPSKRPSFLASPDSVVWIWP